MRTKASILFTIFFCTLLSCNNRQANQRGEQESIDSLIVEQSAITDNSDEHYVPYVPSINLFTIYPINSGNDNSDTLFVSLSDIYILSEHTDSIAVPNIDGKVFDEAQYFHLESKYRKQFLSKIGISETDSIFIYDYVSNSLATFLVKDLKVTAKVSPYISPSDWPLSQYDYMIGFEVDREILQEFKRSFYGALVYVGKENPFAQEQLTPIVWNKIASEKYPSKELQEDYAVFMAGLTLGNTYLFETDSLQYFLQNYHLGEDRSDYDSHRRLLVVDKSTKDIIADKIFGSGEGTSLSPLNYEEENGEINQWTGKLFKDKSPVVFGFEFISFGCPFISVLDRSDEDIYLYCDNRH